MEINTHKIKVNSFSSEIPKELNRELRTFVTVETEIYEVGTQDNQDGTYNEIYKSKCVGSVVVQQVGSKDKIIGKSHRSQSKKMKTAIWARNPDEEYYNKITDKIILHLDEVINFVENL